ncbi:MAG: hypothetical protein JSS81_26450 [Acidobacteria bacterium]|nr:hypothetical protein [Acidobacteriota bacterium]
MFDNFRFQSIIPVFFFGLFLLPAALFAASGDLDATFGTGGRVLLDTGGDDSAAASVIQPDGKTIVAGRSAFVTDYDVSLVRYNSDGTLDPTFGTGGKAVTPFSSYYDAATAVALQPDGRIVVAGYGADNNNLASGYNFALARYTVNGVLDTSFSGDGKQMTDFAMSADYARAVFILGDGRILVAGGAMNGRDDDLALARYLP